MTSQEGFPTPLEIKVLAEGQHLPKMRIIVCYNILNAECLFCCCCCWILWPLLFHPTHSHLSLIKIFLSLSRYFWHVKNYNRLWLHRTPSRGLLDPLLPTRHSRRHSRTSHPHQHLLHHPWNHDESPSSIHWTIQ